MIVDSPAVQRTDLLVEIAYLIAQRSFADGDHLGGEQSRQDAVLFRQVAVQAHAGALLAHQECPPRHQVLAQKLEPDRCFVEWTIIAGADPIEQVRGGNRASDATGQLTVFEKIVGEHGEKEIRADERPTGVDDAESIAVPIGRQPEMQTATAHLAGEWFELPLSAVGAGAAELGVGSPVDHFHRFRHPPEDAVEEPDRGAMTRVAGELQPRLADGGEADECSEVFEIGGPHVLLLDGRRSGPARLLAARRGRALARCGAVDETLDPLGHTGQRRRPFRGRQLEPAVFGRIVAGGDVDARRPPAGDDGECHRRCRHRGRGDTGGNPMGRDDARHRFARKYPSDERSKDAIFNAGLYLATLRKYSDSKSARERYIQRYSSDKQVHAVAFSICESLERQAKFMERRKEKGFLQKWTAAHDCYDGYRKKWGGDDIDLLCQAQYRRLEIMRTKTKYTRGADGVTAELLRSWPRWRKKRSRAKLPRCSAAIAEIKFRGLAEQFKKYAELTIAELNPTDRGTRKFNASIKAKIKSRDALIKSYKDIVAIGVADWALAALYQIGEAYSDSIDKLLNAPIPKKVMGEKLTEEQRGLLRGQLAEKVRPEQEQAIEAYRVCVAKANELGVYNRWSVRALRRLQELVPEEYPPLEERLAKPKFFDALKVATNSVLVGEGEAFKPMDAAVLTGGVRPGQKRKKKSGTSKTKNRKKDKASRGKPASRSGKRRRKK